MATNLLGISAFYHDSAACLVQDGRIVAAAQEERFTRTKHDHAFPRHAIRWCLESQGIATTDLAAIAFYEKPFLKFERILQTYLQFAPRGLRSFVTAMPLWAAFVVVIRRDSAGAAIIRQPRVGYRGHIFTLYKFRTMNAHAELDASPPRDEHDARITRVGRFLRRTSLDELPQLLNVIKGNMSLVGPRPELVSLAAGYRGWQRRRFDAKPGLTGLWQILGRKDLTLEQKLEYDFYYVNNQPLLLDLIIILKTIPQIIFGRGAY